VTRVLGVDPGADGAFALIVAPDLHTVTLIDMPTFSFRRRGGKNRREISEAGIAEIVARLAPDVAWIEQVGARPGQGVVSMFSFGLAVGIVRGVLAAARVPRLYVTPVEWKTAFRLGRDKSEARRRAIDWFPGQADQLARVRDEGRAEAALIALFGVQEPV
jgi:Holliday junction resolvasome RuvABC endonuclease subunit